MSAIIFWLIQLLLLPALSPLLVGFIRKIKAIMQNRRGASIFQPYSDLRKLFHKDEVISKDASWIFRATPYLLFAVTILVGAGLPLFSTAANFFVSDFLVIIYLLALGTFFLALAGLDVGGAFGGFGSSREMTVAALTEGGLIFSVLALSIAAHSANLFDIAKSISTLSLGSFIPVILAFFGFIVALLAETGRFPFDNPATHLELTMIHEAMILEYSGKRLALIEWAAANKLLIFVAMAVNLFFPWGLAGSLGAAAVIGALLVFLAKVMVLCLLIAVLESSMAKFRFFRLPDLLFTSFILSIISIGLIIK